MLGVVVNSPVSTSTVQILFKFSKWDAHQAGYSWFAIPTPILPSMTPRPATELNGSFPPFHQI